MRQTRATKALLGTAAVVVSAAVGFLGLVGWAGSASAQTVYNPCNSYLNQASGGPSTATTNQDCHNEGDADGEIDQQGSSSSGDGVAGQTAGVVSAGDVSVNATNRTDDVDVTTGDATASNNADLDVAAGVAHARGPGAAVLFPCNSVFNIAAGAGDVATTNQDCSNLGDADGSLDQAADATSGDGVGGQVIGAVSGGTANLVLDNETTDSNVTTGNSNFNNVGTASVKAIAFFAGP